MALKKKQPPREPDKSASEYYKLNVTAVEDLVTADVTNSPKVDKKELRKYQSGPRINVADWVKAVFLKVWLGGMACFFFLWGLGTYLPSWLDQLFVLGLALGFIKDLIENSIFRFWAKTPGANDHWMMFPKKNFLFLPFNVLYAYLLLFCVVKTYDTINAVLIGVTGAEGTVPLGVGPILFGLFAAGWDLLFIALKRLGQRMLRDAKESAGRG